MLRSPRPTGQACLGHAVAWLIVPMRACCATLNCWGQIRSALRCELTALLYSCLLRCPRSPGMARFGLLCASRYLVYVCIVALPYVSRLFPVCLCIAALSSTVRPSSTCISVGRALALSFAFCIRLAALPSVAVYALLRPSLPPPPPHSRLSATGRQRGAPSGDRVGLAGGSLTVTHRASSEAPHQWVCRCVFRGADRPIHLPPRGTRSTSV